jgi:phosphohistidine phosphatase
VVTLVLLRHAKAEPHRPDDQPRRLAERGREQCAEVRAWLAEQGVSPDRVVVSSAARARETWELAGVGSVPPVVEDRLYTAGVVEVRELLAETPADVRTLVLVGHNPTFEDLSWELDDSQAARDLSNRGLGTAGVAVFELASWDAQEGRLLAWR